MDLTLFETICNYGIYLTYLLIGVAALGLLVGVVIAVAQNWKEGGYFAVIGLVAILVFFGIGWALSSDDVSQSLIDRGFGDPATYKKSGAGLITFYIMAILAVVLLVVDMVKGLIEGN